MRAVRCVVTHVDRSISRTTLLTKKMRAVGKCTSTKL